MIYRVLLLMFALALPLPAANCLTAATNLAKLIAPTKLAKLDQRGVNSRLYMAVAILEDAGRGGPGRCAWWFVASNAFLYAGYTNVHLAKLTREALTTNLGYASDTLTAEGLADMRRGQAPTIRSGSFAGDKLTVDHIISPLVAPELANVIANLELVGPHWRNAHPSEVGKRQRDLALKFYKAGLLTKQRLEEITRRK